MSTIRPRPPNDKPPGTARAPPSGSISTFCLHSAAPTSLPRKPLNLRPLPDAELVTGMYYVQGARAVTSVLESANFVQNLRGVSPGRAALGSHWISSQ